MAFASANTIPVAGFSLMISHDDFSGARITATAIGLPVRRSLDCWNSTISTWHKIIVVTIIVSKSKSWFFKKIMGDWNRNILPVGTIFYDFSTFYEQRLYCVISVHAIRTAHDYFIILTHTLHLIEQNIIMCFHNKRLLLFTAIVTIFVYKWLSPSGIVVSCSDQKFINVSHKKLILKSKSQFFSKIGHLIHSLEVLVHTFGRSSHGFQHSLAQFTFCRLSVLFWQEMLPNSFCSELHVLCHYHFNIYGTFIQSDSH